MTKAGLFISVFFCLFAGCAISDGTQSDAENKSAPAPHTTPVPTTIVTAQKEIAVVARRQPTQEDIRRIQLHLKEVGFDPGPADGIAGVKTKFAFTRFQSGCARVKPLLDSGNDAWAPGSASNKMPSRAEILSLQSQFRNAGFNSGPVDGIFGERTRLLLAQLRNGCPMAAELAGAVDVRAQSPSKESSISSARERIAKPQAAAGAPRMDAGKHATVAAQPVRPQEDIRIMQLRLRDAGFDPGPFDGVMGPKTNSALQQYEAAQRSGKIKTSAATEIRGQR